MILSEAGWQFERTAPLGSLCSGIPAQELMLKVGVMGYVVPLLFGFDATHEGDLGAPSADASAVAALAAAGSAEANPSRDTGPAFLGLGTERSNMQVSRALFHMLYRWRCAGSLDRCCGSSICLQESLGSVVA